MNKQRYLLVVSGPSGSGKDTVVDQMIRRHPEIERSVSATTRPKRAGETHGVHYHFLSKEEFEQHIDGDALVEWASFIDNYYGTLRSELENRMEKGITCILVIDVQGAENVKRMYPECTTVFLLPPSMEELECRLRGRGTENEERVQRRLQRAVEEMKLARQYDFCLTNEDSDVCADELYAILKMRQEEPC